MYVEEVLGVRMKHSIAYIRIQKNMMGIHFYIGTISIVVQFLNPTIVTIKYFTFT